MRWILAVFVFSLTISAKDTVAETNTDVLLQACEKGMKVAERVQGKIEFVGEKMDPFWEGYLSGVFETLAAERNICTKGDPQRPEYLASVLKTYTAGNAQLQASPAATVVRDALRRAFPWEDNKKGR